MWKNIPIKMCIFIFYYKNVKLTTTKINVMLVIEYFLISLRMFLDDIFFHKFKNVIKKSVYWIY